jgi:hypothetical protein
MPTFLAAVVAMFFLFVSRSAFAQSMPAAIAGAVEDSAGAVFVSAKVVIEPSGRQVATDQQGATRICGALVLTAINSSPVDESPHFCG